MRNWIIRQNSPAVTVEAERIVVKTGRRVSIARGDRLLLMDLEWKFTDISTVLSSTKHETEGGQKSWWELQIHPWQALDQEVEFDLLTTSLMFVSNWRKPRIHLRQSYRSLSDEDFDTITRGEPFIAREAYFTLMLSLPEILRRRFLAQHGPSMSNLYSLYPFRELATHLIAFITQRILSLGLVAIDADQQWKRLRVQVAGAHDVEAYFWSDTDNLRPDGIAEQASAFRALLRELDARSEHSQPLFSSIVELMASEPRQSIERRFERIFQRRINEIP